MIDYWMENGMGPYITLFLVIDLAAQAAVTLMFRWRGRDVRGEGD